jgi:hypothetical protein
MPVLLLSRFKSLGERGVPPKSAKKASIGKRGKGRTQIRTGDRSTLAKENYSIMSDLNRGIMKFKGADTPKAVAISTVLLLGSIAALIFWALQIAYAVN